MEGITVQSADAGRLRSADISSLTTRPASTLYAPFFSDFFSFTNSITCANPSPTCFHLTLHLPESPPLQWSYHTKHSDNLFSSRWSSVSSSSFLLFWARQEVIGLNITCRWKYYFVNRCLPGGERTGHVHKHCPSLQRLYDPLFVPLSLLLPLPVECWICTAGMSHTEKQTCPGPRAPWGRTLWNVSWKLI